MSRKEFRAALVVMPFQSVSTSNLGAAVLKSVLRRAGFSCDAHHFNARFAEKTGLEFYERLSPLRVFPETIFAHALFGKGGTGEIDYPRRFISSLSSVDTFSRETLAEIGGAPKDFYRLLDRTVPETLEECFRSVDWSAYGLVGFSSVFNSHVASLALARKIKEKFPRVKIVFGGSNVEGEMGWETLRAFEWVDYVVNGEGEAALVRLARALADGKTVVDVPGVSFREGGRLCIDRRRAPLADLSRVPRPDYADYFSALRRTGLAGRLKPTLVFEGARGCWWGEKSHCLFCGHNGLAMKFRRKTPTRVLRELMHFMREYGVEQFQASENTVDMEFPRKFFPRLAEELKRRRLEPTFFYEIRATLSKEQLAALAAAGARYLQPGIESFDTDLLRKMRKGVTAIRNIQLLKHCRELDILPIYMMLYGFPMEKAGNYRTVMRLLPRLTHLTPPRALNRVRLDRFSPLQEDPRRWGFAAVRPNKMYDWVYPKSRVDIGKIAYYFQGKPRRRPPVLDTYFEDIEKFVEKWKALYRRSFLVHRSVWNAVIVYDHRLGNFESGGLEFRVHRYEGRWPARVLEFCDSARRWEELREHLLKAGRRENEGELRRLLSRMVRDGILLKEGGCYLSLSLPYQTQGIELKDTILRLEKLRDLFE